MENEIIKTLINSGAPALFLGFVLWKMVPAMSAIALELAKLTGRFEVHAGREEAHMDNLDVRLDTLLNNHLEHLPDAVAEAVMARLEGKSK